MLKSLGKSLSLQSNCVQHKSQVDGTVSVHGQNLAVLPVQWTNCNICLEESKQCNCDHINFEDTKITAAEGANVDNSENDAEANSSFAHAVINMVGMLIGNFLHNCLHNL